MLEAKAKDQKHIAEVFSKNKVKRSALKIFANFPQTAGDLKKNKKNLRLQIRKFSIKFERQKFFSQVLWRAPRQNNIGHDLGTFSTSQKIVLS